MTADDDVSWRSHSVDVNDYVEWTARVRVVQTDYGRLLTDNIDDAVEKRQSRHAAYSIQWWFVVGTGYPQPVPKLLTRFQIRVLLPGFSTAIVQNTTNFVLYLHLFTTLNSIVALVYFPLHIHKLCRSITPRTLVSETTNIISCDAPTAQAVVFVTYFRYYLGLIEF